MSIPTLNRFITIDVGVYGIQSDRGTFHTSDFSRALVEGKLDLPLTSSRFKVPFVFVADEA